MHNYVLVLVYVNMLYVCVCVRACMRVYFASRSNTLSNTQYDDLSKLPALVGFPGVASVVAT